MKIDFDILEDFHRAVHAHLGTIEGMQRALNDLGISPPLVVDGIMGEKTRAAIASFQEASGISYLLEDYLGPRTKLAMLAYLAVGAQPLACHE